MNEDFTEFTEEEILDRIRKQQQEWEYAIQNPAAVQSLEERIAKAALGKGSIGYAESMTGIKIESVDSAGRKRPHTIPSPHNLRNELTGVRGWSDTNRQIIIHLFNQVCVESYIRNGFLAGALIRYKDSGDPIKEFYALVVEVGLFMGYDEDFEPFCRSHAERARNFYQAQDAARRPPVILKPIPLEEIF